MVDTQQRRDGNDTQLLVVDPAEGGHATEPQTEESVGPTLGLKHLKREERVVVDSVDDHLHEVDLVALDLDVLRSEDGHSHDNEALDTVVDVATEAQHHSLGKLAGTLSLDAALDIVAEHVGNHRVQSLYVLGLLDKMRGSKLDKVVEGRQHILEIVLATSLEGGVDELEGLPHVR